MLPLRYSRFWLWLGIAMLCVSMILALLPPGRPPPIGNFDKIVHLAAFAVFMTWFCGIYESRLAPRIAFMLISYGVLMELLQGLTPTRQPDVADLVADGIGILLGWTLCAAGLRRWSALVESWLPTRTS